MPMLTDADVVTQTHRQRLYVSQRGHAVVDRVHMHDLHATILHLMGLDHERLVYPYAGRDFRLTDVYGRVVESVVAGV